MSENPKFTKKHFETLASWLKNSKVPQKELIASELSAIFKADNGRFKRAKFYKASGIEAST